jgi:hypothetical protein
MTEVDHDYRCPLAVVDRRLAQVHQHWHEAERAYFDPDGFLVAIQTAIQTLRTVTFILQSNKRLFSNFDDWYDPWQDKLRADPLMRWMVDARNKIEKQGDLEMHSFVRAEIMASYYDDGPREDVPAELFQSPAELISRISSNAYRMHAFKDGILRLQRRWVENTLPDYELLDAVGIAYGKLAELLDDAHMQLDLPAPSTMVGEVDHTEGRAARDGRLPCMIGHSDIRSHNIWLATGQALELEQKQVKFDRDTAEKAAKKYTIDPKEIAPPTISAPEGLLDSLFATGRKMITAAGYHDTIAFLLHGRRPIKIVQLALQEHGEKYLVFRNLANEVTRCGADGVILIGEIWMAAFDSSQPYRRAADTPEKAEYLSATLVTKTGDPMQLQAKISRVDGVLSLGETKMVQDQAPIMFSPIYAAWGRELPDAWRKVFTSRDGATED